MFWLVIAILCGLVFAGALLGLMVAVEKFIPAVVMVITVGVFILVTLICSIARLQTGQVGLVYNFAGKLTGTVTKPGVIWKAPWTSIVKESVQVQRENFVLGQDNQAVTEDQQEITANLAVNYEVDPDHVLDLYKNVGASWKVKLIDSRVLQDFKEVTATYPTIAITNHREQLRRETLARLKKELAPYSVTVTDFFIQNIGFSKAYTDAITAKQVQVQRAQQAQAKVAQASAEAAQVVATARGEAEAIRLQGAALRANPEVLTLRAIEKLNPKAQVIFCANASCPSFLGSLGGFTGK